MRLQYIVGCLAAIAFSLVKAEAYHNIAFRAGRDTQTFLNGRINATISQLLGGSEETWNPVTVRRYMLEALDTMQTHFFEVWIGKWPTSIDWTGAVLGTHVSATMNIISRSREFARNSEMASNSSCVSYDQILEDQVNRYFSQIAAYYFGENSFQLRFQAHDDMLWVNLGWLEGIKLIKSHDLLKPNSHVTDQVTNGNHWHGTQFIDAFAHRAHIFYDLVARAWDRDLCGGGLNWNPKLEIYKNTVTNTQFISATVGMYLFHTGDKNTSPIVAQSGSGEKQDILLEPSEPHDPAFLALAKESYQWVQNINLTNSQGLYVDGYHLSSWIDPTTGNKVYGNCIYRNEMVYTYNQGVILSGSRQLWEATNDPAYLVDAHKLVRNVMAATGWQQNKTGWQGLGHDGLLADSCDPLGSCSQDAQTFKGIFFHHLTLLCEPLPTKTPLVPGHSFTADEGLANVHAASCREYIPWVEHNSKAAWSTRNADGVMGSWWGSPNLDLDRRHLIMPKLPDGADDWRNPNASYSRAEGVVDTQDWNDRGRGRTVESHSGGLAVLRALYALHVFYD